MKLRRLNLKKRRILSAYILKKKPIKFMDTFDEVYWGYDAEPLDKKILRFGKRGTPVTTFQKLPI
jgi:hypothetical protein